MDRTVPVEATIGTIEIDLFDEEATITVPPDAPVTVEERRQGT
jgi:hypothetical protein